jgi:hypothetical protein
VNRGLDSIHMPGIAKVAPHLQIQGHGPANLTFGCGDPQGCGNLNTFE